VYSKPVLCDVSVVTALTEALSLTFNTRPLPGKEAASLIGTASCFYKVTGGVTR